VVFICINMVLVIMCGYGLFFTSFFWLGTQEEHQALIETSSVFYFIKRFLLNLIFILIAMGLMMLLTRVLGRRVIMDLFVKKILLIDVLVLLSSSAVMIFLSMQ
jgi:hypothetical protein